MTKSKIGNRNALIQALIGGFVMLLGFLLFIFEQTQAAVSVVLVTIGGGSISQGIRKIRNSNKGIL